MKKFIATIISVLLFNVSFSQTDTTFNNLYSPYHGTTGINSLINNDSFYYALYSQLDTPDLIQNYGILKFNKYGELLDSSLWGHLDTSVAFNFGHTFIKTTDNYFVFCGSSKDSQGTVRGILVKVNCNLDTLWTKWFNHPDTLIASQANPSVIYSTLTDIKETPDGGYIIIGNYNKDCINLNVHGFLIKTDTSGNILWFKLMPSSIISSNYLYDIEIDPIDSGFYFPSNRSNQAPQNISLFKTDKFGNVLWFTKVNLVSYPKYPQYPVDAEVIDSSTVIVVSTIDWENTVTSHIHNSVMVTSVNTNTHSINWENEFSFNNERDCPTLHQSIGANLTPNGNIAISTTMIVYNMGYRGSLLLINQNGDSLWQRYYAHTYSDSNNVDLQLNDLVVCDDGGFLMGGFYHKDLEMYSHAWLVKTDSLGFAPATFTLSVEEKHLVIIQQPLLYPNPAQNVINLRFNENQNSQINIQVYNSSGVLLKQEKHPASKKEYRINIEDLETGVYFIKILSDDKKVFSGKFVKM